MQNTLLTFETAKLAGQLLMENNAEAYRVEEIVMHIFKSCPDGNGSVIALATGLYMSFSVPNQPPLTYVCRIPSRQINLMQIAKINDISFQLNHGKLTINQAYQQLKQLQTSDYTQLQKNLAKSLFILTFLLLIGGNLNELLLITPLALILPFLESRLLKKRLNVLMIDAVLSFLISCFIHPFSQLFRENLLIVACIMPLVPGTALTNGVRDIFKGDYMSGTAKLLEAIMIALFISVGIAFGLLLAKGGLRWI